MAVIFSPSIRMTAFARDLAVGGINRGAADECERLGLARDCCDKEKSEQDFLATATVEPYTDERAGKNDFLAANRDATDTRAESGAADVVME